jgi:hypothetical protein
MSALTGNDLPHEVSDGLRYDFSEDKNVCLSVRLSVCLSARHWKNRRQCYLSNVLDAVPEAGKSHSDFEIQFLQNFEKYL